MMRKVDSLQKIGNEAPRTDARGFFLFKPSANPASAGIRFTPRLTPAVLRMNNRKKLNIKILFLLLTISSFLITTPTYAQEVSPATKKNVVQNYKADLNKNITFGTDCSLKPRGDANCDKIVNQFDLSIWEVEFNSPNSPRRSDFNADGVINLLDFGVWRNTFYPPSSTSTHSDKYFAQSEGIINLLSSIFNFQFSIFNSANAQEPPASTQPLRSSLPFVSNSGNSMITNSDGNSTQQVNFDSQGNPLNSQFFNSNGDLITGVTFQNSGATTVSTQQDGISIQTTRTGEGAVFQFFRNPDGTLIANKSWPTQASYDLNDPPQAVTLPGKDNNSFLTLNIQPNGNSLLQEIDKNGNVIKLSYLTGSGIYGSYNTQNNSTVTSLASAKVTFMSIDNNLGGKTIYNIIDNLVLSVTQTDSKNNTWIATPQGNYESWELIQVNNPQQNPTTVADPMKAINSTSPNPLDLIKTWNYYTEAAKTSNPTIDFATGFNSNLPALSRQVTAANDLYKIAQTPTPPDVLGIIKEAYAETNRIPSTDPHKSDTVNGYQTVVDTYTGSNGATVMTVATYGPVGTAAAQNQIASSQTVISATTEIPSLSGKDPTEAAQSLATISGTRAVDGSGTPLGTNTLATMPGTLPAEAADKPTGQQPAAQPVAQPNNPLPGPVGDWKSNQQGDKPGTEANAVRDAAARAAGNKAQETAGSAELKAGVSRSEYSKAFDSAYQEKFGRSITFDTLAIEERNLNANFAFVQTFVSSTIPGITSADGLVNGNIWNSPEAIQARQQAINSLKAQGVQVNFTVKDFDTAPPGHYAPGTKTTSDAASAPAAPTVPPPPPGTGFPPGTSGLPGSVADGARTGTFNNLSTSTTRGADGFWTTQIAGGAAAGGATHHFGYDKNGKDGATSLVEFFDKADGTRTTVRDGVMTNIEGKIDGQQISIDLGAGTFSIPAGLTAEQATGFAQQQLAERAYSMGARGADEGYAGDIVESWSVDDQGNVTTGTSHLQGMATCFLKGTLISTPNGQIPIETLKPGDNVYSYNEKTGQKQISDFKELDINFVDEYLIINDKIQTTTYHPFYIMSFPRMRESNKQTVGMNFDQMLGKNQPNISNWIPAFAGMTLATVRADELKVGDILPTEEGKYVPVYSIERIKAPKTTVYNLMGVSPNNNFFAEGILVHNYPGPDNDNYDASFNEVSFDAESSSDESTSESTQDQSAPAEGDTGGDSGGNDDSGGDSGGSVSIDATI